MSKTNLKNKNSLHFLLCVSVIVVLLLSAVNISEYQIHRRVLGAQTVVKKDTSELEEEKKFWEEFLKKYPTYYEGWMELSKIESSLGNIDSSNDYFLKARVINPNKN